MTTTKKIILSIIVVGAVVGGILIYRNYQSNQAVTKYVLGTVEKGTLVVSVSGSGQVAASNQVDLKPKVSGELTSLLIKDGQTVKAGQLIATVDSTDARKAVRDAQDSLETARLSLEKLQEPVDELSLLQSQNTLDRAKESKQQTIDDLRKTYTDGYNLVTADFLELPDIMTGLQDILFASTLSTGQSNIDFYADAVRRYDESVDTYRTQTQDAYDLARAAYDANFDDYKASTSRDSDVAVEALMNQTYGTVRLIFDAVKNSINLVQFYQDQLAERSLRPATLSDTHLTSLTSYMSKVNSQSQSLLNSITSIKNAKESLVDADRTIIEREKSLANLQEGPDTLDLRSQNLTIRQREEAVQDARAKLADYEIRALFAGVVSGIDVNRGDEVSGSTVIAKLTTSQKIVEISLNEVDVAKIQVGQKATITFDALTDLSLTGKVFEVDTVGTTSQGVVTYAVKLSLDSQDERIKPAMSSTVAIIVETKPDVLLVPSGAVKSSNGASYVEVVANPPADLPATGGVELATIPERRAVEVGSTNDEQTEIVSGLAAGDAVVLSKIQSSAATTTTNGSSGASTFRIPGIGGGAGTRAPSGMGELH